MRALALLGAVAIIAAIDGFISGFVAATWGDWWGNRLDDLALFVVAYYGINRWIDRRMEREGICS